MFDNFFRLVEVLLVPVFASARKSCACAMTTGSSRLSSDRLKFPIMYGRVLSQREHLWGQWTPLFFSCGAVICSNHWSNVSSFRHNYSVIQKTTPFLKVFGISSCRTVSKTFLRSINATTVLLLSSIILLPVCVWSSTDLFFKKSFDRPVSPLRIYHIYISLST